MKRMKKLIIGIISLLVLIAPTFSLFGCKKDQTLTFAKAYDMSAIAGIEILNTKVINDETVTLASNPQALDQTQKDGIISNLIIAKSVANNGITKTETVKSTREGYEFYYTIKATDYLGVEKTYEFYYNKTDITEKDDKFENEKEYRLDGLVILDGVEYSMVGEQEEEDNESEFSFKIAIDNKNYVVIEQETERNESEFSYTAYKNGIKVFETETEYEVNINGNVELEFEIYDKENSVYKKYKYEFFDRNGEEFAKVMIKDGNNFTLFTTVKIITTADGIKYEFLNN